MAAQIHKRPRWPMAAREWPSPAVNGSCGAQPSATFSFRQEPNNRKRERVCFHEKKKPFLFCFMFLTWSVVLLLHLSPPLEGCFCHNLILAACNVFDSFLFSLSSLPFSALILGNTLVVPVSFFINSCFYGLTCVLSSSH